MRTTLIIFFFFLQQVLIAQMQLSFGAGTLLYNGDIGYKAPYNKAKFSFHVGAEKAWKYGLSYGGILHFGSASGNDRIDTKGNFMTESPNFNRAFNFKSSLTNVCFQAKYYANNGYLMKKEARLTPFAFVGLGFTTFRVLTDQYFQDSTGLAEYVYQNPDNLIRYDVPEGEELYQDGIFETNITKMNLEDKTHSNFVMNFSMGIGADFRITQRLHTQVNLMMLFPFTDYIDGVGGNLNTDLQPDTKEYYLANPSGLLHEQRGNSKKDNFFYPSVSLSYHFGKAKENNVLENVDVEKKEKVKKEKSPKVIAKTEEKKTQAPKTESKSVPPPKVAPKAQVTEKPKVEMKSQVDIPPKVDPKAQVTEKPKVEMKSQVATPPKVAPKAQVTEKPKVEMKSQVAIPPKEQVVEKPKTQVASTKSLITFDFGKSTLNTEHEAILLGLIEQLAESPKMKVVLHGYTNSTGNATVGIKIPKERVIAVQNYLISQGLKSEKIVVEYHEVNPSVPAELTKPRTVEVEMKK